MKGGTLRNVVFGVQDSLVSTVGLVSGVASAQVGRSTLLLTGFVLVAVEAFSMAVGSFLSDASERELRMHRDVRLGSSVWGGFVMLVSYLAAGFLVLAPYLLLPDGGAFGWSIAVSLVALFVLGAASGRLAGLPVVRRGIRMALLGGIATLLGIWVASLVR
jgi:VIT1/CCC1 family predicted Fe2+/Mn2+ transporter